MEIGFLRRRSSSGISLAIGGLLASTSTAIQEKDSTTSARHARSLPAGARSLRTRLRARFELAIYALIATEFVWVRLIDMKLSFWDDEARSAVQYIDPGLSGIYSAKAYGPNNHILYDLLSWVTVNALGHDEPTYRIWSVLPAIAAGAILIWWTRRRMGRVAGLLAAGIIFTSPLLLQWSVQARGYGLAQLGMVLVFVAACELEQIGASRRWLVVLGAGAFIATASHSATLVPVILVLAWLLRRRDLRRDVVKAAACAAVALLLVTGPILTTMVSSDSSFRTFGKPVAPDGVVTGPLNLGAYNGQLLITGSANRGCNTMCYSTAHLVGWGAPLFIAAMLGIATLWITRRRGSLGVLAIPLFGTFVVFAAGSVWLADRFALMLLPAYAILGAVGAAEVVHLLARRRLIRPVLALAACALAVLGALRIYRANQRLDPPTQDYKEVALAFKGSGIRRVFTDDPPNFNYGLRWYLGRRLVYLPLGPLEGELCASTGPLAFIQHAARITAAEDSCLKRRNASALDFTGEVLRLWLVQSPGRPAISARAVASAPTAAGSGSQPTGTPPASPPPSANLTCTPSRSSFSPASATPGTGETLSVTLSPGFSVTDQVLGAAPISRLLSSSGQAFIKGGAKLLGVTLRESNTGAAAIRAGDPGAALFVRDQSGRLWRYAEVSCRGASAAYAARIGASLGPNSILAPGRSGTTAIVFVVPRGAQFYLENKKGQYVTLP